MPQKIEVTLTDSTAVGQSSAINRSRIFSAVQLFDYKTTVRRVLEAANREITDQTTIPVRTAHDMVLVSSLAHHNLGVGDLIGNRRRAEDVAPGAQFNPGQMRVGAALTAVGVDSSHVIRADGSQIVDSDTISKSDLIRIFVPKGSKLQVKQNGSILIPAGGQMRIDRKTEDFRFIRACVMDGPIGSNEPARFRVVNASHHVVHATLNQPMLDRAARDAVASLPELDIRPVVTFSTEFSMQVHSIVERFRNLMQEMAAPEEDTLKRFERFAELKAARQEFNDLIVDSFGSEPDHVMYDTIRPLVENPEQFLRDVDARIQQADEEVFADKETLIRETVGRSERRQVQTALRDFDYSLAEKLSADAAHREASFRVGGIQEKAAAVRSEIALVDEEIRQLALSVTSDSLLKQEERVHTRAVLGRQLTSQEADLTAARVEEGATAYLAQQAQAKFDGARMGVHQVNLERLRFYDRFEQAQQELDTANADIIEDSENALKSLRFKVAQFEVLKAANTLEALQRGTSYDSTFEDGAIQDLYSQMADLDVAESISPGVRESLQRSQLSELKRLNKRADDAYAKLDAFPDDPTAPLGAYVASLERIKFLNPGVSGLAEDLESARQQLSAELDNKVRNAYAKVEAHPDDPVARLEANIADFERIRFLNPREDSIAEDLESARQQLAATQLQRQTQALDNAIGSFRASRETWRQAAGRFTRSPLAAAEEVPQVPDAQVSQPEPAQEVVAEAGLHPVGQAEHEGVDSAFSSVAQPVTQEGDGVDYPRADQNADASDVQVVSGNQ